MFKLRDKDTGKETVIYGTRERDGGAQFLIYYGNSFAWSSSSYFEPIEK